MENGIRELTEVEVDQVDGGNSFVYWVGFAVGYAAAGASAFYADLPVGYALL